MIGGGGVRVRSSLLQILKYILSNNLTASLLAGTSHIAAHIFGR